MCFEGHLFISSKLQFPGSLLIKSSFNHRIFDAFLQCEKYKYPIGLWICNRSSSLKWQNYRNGLFSGSGFIWVELTNLDKATWLEVKLSFLFSQGVLPQGGHWGTLSGFFKTVWSFEFASSATLLLPLFLYIVLSCSERIFWLASTSDAAVPFPSSSVCALEAWKYLLLLPSQMKGRRKAEGLWRKRKPCLATFIREMKWG